MLEDCWLFVLIGGTPVVEHLPFMQIVQKSLMHWLVWLVTDAVVDGLGLGLGRDCVIGACTIGACVIDGIVLGRTIEGCIVIIGGIRCCVINPQSEIVAAM